MRPWLLISGLIDRLNETLGRLTLWLVLAAGLISATNALIRKSLGLSSNAWLEIQWYLFAAMVLLAAGYTLKHNGHVRIDVLASRLSERARAWIEILGTLCFLLPLCVLMVILSWPGFMDSYVHQEWSPDAGGLIRWPVRLLIPIGFLMLALQGVSELIKRIAYLQGLVPLAPEKPKEQV